jgi:hypothetical protein
MDQREYWAHLNLNHPIFWLSVISRNKKTATERTSKSPRLPKDGFPLILRMCSFNTNNWAHHTLSHLVADDGTKAAEMLRWIIRWGRPLLVVEWRSYLSCDKSFSIWRKCQLKGELVRATKWWLSRTWILELSGIFVVLWVRLWGILWQYSRRSVDIWKWSVYSITDTISSGWTSGTLILKDIV